MTSVLTDNKGFTLLEILVVLTIMGFVLAMESASGAEATGLSLAKVRETHLYQAQDLSFFTVINSIGEKFHPSSGSRFWGIDFDADGDIGM